MKYIYILFISLVIASCSNLSKNAVVIKNFPKTITLTGDSLDNFDAELGALALEDVGDYIFCQLHKADHFFSVYSKESLKKVTNLFRRGNGHMEFIAPEYLGQFTTENDDIKIWILERVLDEYYKVNLSKTIRDNKLIIEKEYDISSYNKANYRSIYFLNDSLLFGTEDGVKGCVHKLLYPIEKRTQAINHTIEFPENNPSLHRITQTMTTKHPEKESFASVFFCFPQIDFINNKGDIYKTIAYKEIVSPHKVIESNYTYFDIVCSDANYVYALYNPEDHEQEDYNDQITESSVFVFTWEGEPVSEYKIAYASNICIDRKNQKLYGFDNRTGSFIVDVYNLPK